MPIITASEVKTLLQIPPSDTSKDTLIDMLIPLVQDKIVSRLNNSFSVVDCRVVGSTLAFVSGTPAKITDSSSSFLTTGFFTGCEVLVSGSLSNDGYYVAGTVLAGEIDLATDETLVNESSGREFTITRVQWPTAIKLEVAFLINYYSTRQGKLVNTESLPGGYSTTYKSDLEVWSVLNKYRKPYR